MLGVSTSGYYAWRTRGLSGRARRDAELTEHIIRIHENGRGTYGAPRIHAELTMGMGIHCSRKRVARLMRKAGLVGVHRCPEFDSPEFDSDRAHRGGFRDRGSRFQAGLRVWQRPKQKKSIGITML